MGKDQDRRKKKINWKTYNRELVERGKKVAKFETNLREYVKQNWEKEVEEKNMSKDRSKGGRDFQYPDILFVLLYVIKVFNRMSYRNIEGYAHTMFDNVPNFRTIQDRVNMLGADVIKNIDDEIIRTKVAGKRLKIVWDGTGLQVNDSYIWYEEKHKKKKKRKWKKVHFAADIDSGMIVGFKVHEEKENEAKTERLFQFMEMLLQKIGDISVLEKFFGDGAYDNKAFFELLKKLGIKPVIRINKDTIDFIKRQLEYNKNKRGTPYTAWKPQDERQKVALNQVDWKKYVKEEQYGQRSAVEGDIGSFKGSFGGSLFSKIDNMIFKEVLTKVLVYNVMRA